MKYLWILMVAVCCSTQTGSVNSESNRVEIVESQNGQTVDVHKTDDVVVTFVAAGGTGYAWQMESTELATAKEEDVPLNPGLPGGPVKMMFHVRVNGTVTLKFNFLRPWIKDKAPDKTFSVTLRVQ